MVYPCFHLCNFVALQFCFADFSSYVPLAMSSKYKIEPTLCIWSSVLAFKMSWWSLSLLPLNDSIFITCLARLDLHLHAVCSSNFPYHKFLFFHYFIGTFLLPLRNDLLLFQLRGTQFTNVQSLFTSHSFLVLRFLRHNEEFFL